MNFEQFEFIQKVSILVRNFGFAPDVADFIGCQFALESNFGKSNLAVKYNNYCGMKFPYIRISLAYSISKLNPFAQYNGLVQCVYDYMLCLNYHHPVAKIKESISEFCLFIKNWYCPDYDYINRITNLYKNYKDGQTA